MKRFVLFVFIFPQIVVAQTGGILFEKNIDLDSALRKAKEKGKMVFVDCYASWCGPCKRMDKEVFELRDVGKYFNERFISIKIQLDTTPRDDASIRVNYADAVSLKVKYSITAMPTFLFIDADRGALHRDYGFRKAADFIDIGMAALDSNRQFYTQLRKHDLGVKNYEKMPYLSRLCKEFNDSTRARLISEDYISGYMSLLPMDKLYTRLNIKYLFDFVRSVNSRGFTMICTHENLIDSVMGIKDYAVGFICWLIEKDVIGPRLKIGSLTSVQYPDWDNIEKYIMQKYGQAYAERCVLEAKVNWSRRNKRWRDYCLFLVERVEKYGSFGIGNADFRLNNHAWDLFLHSEDKIILSKALEWSDSAVRLNPIANWIDTHANILYKLGKKEEALSEERKAVELEPKTKEFSENLKKMAQNEPTWPIASE